MVVVVVSGRGASAIVSIWTPRACPRTCSCATGAPAQCRGRASLANFSRTFRPRTRRTTYVDLWTRVVPSVWRDSVTTRSIARSLARSAVTILHASVQHVLGQWSLVGCVVRTLIDPCEEGLLVLAVDAYRCCCLVAPLFACSVCVCACVCACVCLRACLYCCCLPSATCRAVLNSKHKQNKCTPVPRRTTL